MISRFFNRYSKVEIPNPIGTVITFDIFSI